MPNCRLPNYSLPLRLLSLWAETALEVLMRKNVELHNKIASHKQSICIFFWDCSGLFISWILFENRRTFWKTKYTFEKWTTIIQISTCGARFLALSHFLKVHSIQKDLIWLSRLSIRVFCCLQYKKIISSWVYNLIEFWSTETIGSHYFTTYKK